MPCCHPRDHRAAAVSESATAQAGAVIVIVLIILAAVAGVVLRDAALSWDVAQDATLLAEEYQADLLAESCLELALDTLLKDDTPEWDGLSDTWAAPLLGEQYRVLIVPANCMLNINHLPADEDVQAAFLRFFPRLQQPRQLFLALQDWVDSDRTDTLSGGELRLYQDTAPAYRPPNRSMTSLHELELVHGFEEVANATAMQYWDVWNIEPLNLNFVPAELLQAYAPELQSSLGRIQSMRLGKGIRTVEDLQRLMGAREGTLQKWSTTSTRFLVEIETLTGNLYHKRRYIVQRQNGASTRSGLTLMGRDQLETRVASPDDALSFSQRPATMEAIYDARWNNASAF